MNLQFKITLAVVMHILLVGIIGNIFLYVFFMGAVSRKGEQLDHAYLEAVGGRLDRNLSEVFSLATLCANDPAVLKALSGQSGARDLLNAQDRMNAFLQANPVGAYFDKFILFDDRSLLAAANTRHDGAFSDLDAIRALPLYRRLVSEQLPYVSGFDHSITPWNKRDCYILILRVKASYSSRAEGYLYAETGLDIITGVFEEYDVPPGIFAVVTETSEAILQNKSRLDKIPEGIPVEGKRYYRYKGQDYRLDRMPLENKMLTLYNNADRDSLDTGDRSLFYVVLAALVMSLFAALGLNIALSFFVTRPVRVLIRRIRKISENGDFSFDPEIEKQKGEIGLIGKTVNELSGNTKNLLKKMEELYRDRTNAEIALLQTRINPHFLYNTLDSIRWMANIQQNPSIADLTRRLINLLRNIAGRTDIPVTLREELHVLEDYSEIMSVRFMGSFEVINRIPEAVLDYRIPRLTLQPLVENAILHGIDPSGKFSTITLSAFEEQGCGTEYLCIVVEDTGIGMSAEELETIKTGSGKKSGPSLNHIGIANVEERLKLLYDDTCGLFFESRKGEYTRVTVKIVKEK